MTRLLAKLKDRICIPPCRRSGRFCDELGRLRFLLVLVIMLFFGHWLGKNIIVEPPSKWFGDILLRTRKAEVPRHTRFIRIDETDREKALLGRTPVDGPALVRAVCAIAVSRPRVIVVDLDTSSENSFPAEMKGHLPDFYGVPVVWAVNADWGQIGNKLALKSGRFLGGNTISHNYGFARMPTGVDGVVRGWFHTVEVNGLHEPSLALRAARYYCPKCEIERYQPSFAVSYHFPEMHLLDFVSPLTGPIDKSKAGDCPRHNEQPPDPRLTGMIAVLGAIHPTEDRHETPWGTKPGAELVAMSIEESVNPHPLVHLQVPFKLIVKLLLAILVAALHHYFWPMAATAVTLVLLPFGVLLADYAAFFFGDYNLAAVPLIVGILLEQLVNSTEKGEHWARRAKHDS